MKAVCKLARRTIRSFRGRYLALLLIVTLSVGFFSGLKITKDAMANTCQQYLDEQGLYDYRLISTAGFPQQAVEQFAQLSFVETAEGSYSLDAMAQWGEDLHPLHLLSLPEEVSLPSLTAGRLPEADGECLADSAVFDPGDIGTVIHLTDEEGAAPAGEVTRAMVWGKAGRGFFRAGSNRPARCSLFFNCSKAKASSPTPSFRSS